VLKEAISALPRQHFIYYGDTKNIPYGEKTKEEVVALCKKGVDFLAGEGAGAIVIACNTASSAAGQILRRQFNIPIICMEPAINLAYKEKGNKVLVLATNLTLHLEKYLRLKDRLNVEIDEIAAPKLVELAEDFKFGGDEVSHYLNKVLSGYHLDEYSHLVLGCTHFSFFQETLKAMLPQNIKVLDGNRGTVEHLRRGDILSPESCDIDDSNGRQNVTPTIYFTDNSKNNYKENIKNYLGCDNIDIKTI